MDASKDVPSVVGLSPEELEEFKTFCAVFFASGFEVKLSKEGDELLVSSRVTGEVFSTKRISDFKRSVT